MNHMLFIDLVNFCSVTKHGTHAYFHQRLRINGVPNEQYRSTKGTPIERYTELIATQRMVIKDMGVAKYMMEMPMLFKGIEYYIGLERAAIRAIDAGNADFVYYILTFHPNDEELKHIVLRLRSNYFKTKKYLLNSSIQQKLHKIYRGVAMIDTTVKTGLWSEDQKLDQTVDPNFYPYCKEDYEDYIDGKEGRNIKCNSLAYQYGVIHGKQDRLFKKIRFEISHYMWNEIMMYGTQFMISKSIGSKLKGALDAAIEGNNLEGVRYILEKYGRQIQSIKSDPLSNEMIDLLNEFKITMSKKSIAYGAIKSANYDLIDVINDRLHVDKTITGFMLELMCSKNSDDQYNLGVLFYLFQTMDDNYRMEVMLKCGYRPEIAPAHSTGLSNYQHGQRSVQSSTSDRNVYIMKNSKLDGIIKVDPTKYTYLSSPP